MKKFFCFLCILSFLVANSYSQSNTLPQVDYYKVSKVKIFIVDRTDINKLREQGIAIEKTKVFEDYFETYLDSVQIEKLKLSGYTYEIIIDDVTKDYLERTKEAREKIKLQKPTKPAEFGYGSMGGFYTFDEVVAQLDAMRSQYPNLITAKDSIGSSIEGRTIWAVKISDNPNIDEDEPEIFYNSLIHANEVAGMMSVIYFMYYLLENYGSDAEVTYLVNNREFYFVPVINPDGNTYNQQISPNGGGMWRKNLRDNNNDGLKSVNDGVDLARNFSFMWGYDNIGSSPIISDWNYRGGKPFSEPESQVIRDFILSRNFKIVHNFHTYWNVMFLPWGYNNTQTPDADIFNTIVDIATQLNGYRNGFDVPDSYTCNGYPCDWIYGEQTIKPKIFSFLSEVGNDNDGAWPIPARIFPLAEENCYPNKVIAWGPGIIDNPPHLTKANIDLKFVKTSTDTIKISASEYNPDNHSSIVIAKVLTLKDSLLDEVQLSQIDSTFAGKINFNPTEEGFYKILLQQNGIDIPSKLFYNKLRFTTAGPVIVDSLYGAFQPAQLRFAFRPYLRNLSTTVQIVNPSVIITCNDSMVTNITQNKLTATTLSPGQRRPCGGATSIYYDPSKVKDTLTFNIHFEIYSDGFAYWNMDTTISLVLTEIDEEKSIPTSYSLNQNYPNPFNPNTVISWQSPVSSHQTVKVFDVLGNEIATLVDEYKQAGRYEVDFNASTLPSGVYFYQLIAGEFVNTKKMILLK